MKTLAPLRRVSLSCALTVILCASAQLRSAEPASGTKMTMEGKTMQHCMEMKEKKEKMSAEMKAQDAELIIQVARMNAAVGGEKLAQIAAIVTRLVEQRIATTGKMGKMQDEMMAHMMEHVQMGKESMAECPMMKSMSGSDEKAQSHEGHH